MKLILVLTKQTLFRWCHHLSPQMFILCIKEKISPKHSREVAEQGSEPGLPDAGAPTAFFTRASQPPGGPWETLKRIRKELTQKPGLCCICLFT